MKLNAEGFSSSSHPLSGTSARSLSAGGPLIDLMGDEPLAALMEVHSGLSARIADEAGFEALWASGLAISSMMGLRDSNEASWSQILTVVEWIADASERPLLVDGDTGHGNFNNARRFARKLAERGAAGVCFEDKLFPKTNSFIGEDQELAPVEEFSGKIAATKDACADYPFAIVARTEALVSGRSLTEALDRAHAYHDAGADAVLIHSKSKTSDEVIAFATAWAKRAPLIVVPTTYESIDLDQASAAGISAVIWANHSVRASTSAMRHVCGHIRENGRPTGWSGRMVQVPELFSLLNYDELQAAEDKYLPGRRA